MRCTILLLCLLVGCSDSSTGIVTAKRYVPPGLSFDREPASPARWFFTVKPHDGSAPIEVQCDETSFHKYEVGDRYP